MSHLAFGISLGDHGSTEQILKVVTKKYTIYRGGVVIEQISDFDQLEATCQDRDEIEIELYDDIDTTDVQTVFHWSGHFDYICPEDDIGCFIGEAYKFRDSSLIIGNPTGCGVMIYKDVLDGGGLLEITPDDFQLFTEKMIELRQAGRLPANSKIGAKTACCS